MPETDTVPATGLESCESAVHENPLSATAWFRLGLAHRTAGRVEAALACFQRVLTLDPRHADAYVECGMALKRQGNVGAAVDCYLKALKLDPRSTAGLFNLGNALRERGDQQHARSCYEAALAVQPGYFQAWNNLGLLLDEMGNLDGALTHYRKAASLNPELAGTWMNIGNVLKRQNLLPEAVDSYRQAIGLQPDLPEAHHSLGLALLATGNFEEGWAEFEWRLRCRVTGSRIGARSFPRPLWDGSPLDGRTLFVYAEQGYGDTIQFARYLPLLSKSMGRVYFGCYPDLLGLFKGFPGVDLLVDITASTLPGFDAYAALLSLPGLMRTTEGSIPPAQPELGGIADVLPGWRERVNANGIKVGLVWMSNTHNRIGREKSFPLNALAPLAGVEGVSFYSLQKGEGATEIGASSPVLRMDDLAEDLDDFSDTAAAIARLDLVISVDTAVAHLAGTMGKPIWTILPFAADWRWLLDREDTPWYPTMTLFRQRHPGNWDEVIHRVTRRLSEFVRAARPGSTK